MVGALACSPPPGFVASLDGDPFARGLARLLSSTKWLPRFVAIPPPGGMRTTIDSELPESVANSWTEQDLGWLAGHDWGARTADVLWSVWKAYVYVGWPHRRAMLERDVTYRAGLLAACGWPRALQRMSRG